MAFVSLIVFWIVLSSIGLTVVYRTGLRIERCCPTISLLYFVLLGQGVLIASCITAFQAVGVEQASCNENSPNTDRLNGMSPSEFRARCEATRNNFEALDWRKS